MTPRRRPSLALSLALLLLLGASADAASSPFWRRPARALFGEEDGKAAAASPAKAPAPSPPPPPTPTPTPTALCADDGPEGCGALVIQPPAAKAALKDYVDCVTVDPAAAGEACVRKGSGNASSSSSSAAAAVAARAESDPRDACPDDPLFDDRGEFSASDWGAVADKVRVVVLLLEMRD